MEKRRFESFQVFSCLKKVNPRILSTFKRSFSKTMGKTLGSHIIHSLGGEYCWILRDSEPIRLLKSLRSRSVYTLKWNIAWPKVTVILLQLFSWATYLPFLSCFFVYLFFCIVVVVRVLAEIEKEYELDRYNLCDLLGV